MLPRRHVAAWVFAMLAAACFDPLYEDDAPLTASWRVCCQGGAINTCLCENAATCATPVFACAAGRCSESISCTSGSAGGGSGTGGGSSSTGGGAGGGLQDAGTATGGGGGASGGGGGATGGGGGSAADAGVISDGGAGGGGGATGGGGGATGGGGGATGGGSGATGGGGGSSTTAYEFCCQNGIVASCPCASTGCGATFTPCAGGRCVVSGACR